MRAENLPWTLDPDHHAASKLKRSLPTDVSPQFLQSSAILVKISYNTFPSALEEESDDKDL